jgi:hypothetical protein
MEKGQAKKGKGKEVASEETNWAAPSEARGATDLSSSWGPSRFGSAVAAPAKKKRPYEMEAQIRSRKKKNMKNRGRLERKAAGLKINTLDDVPTFDESDSDDRSEVYFSTSQPIFCFRSQLSCHGEGFLDPHGCPNTVPFRAWLVHLRVFFALVRFSLGDGHGEVCGGFILPLLELFCDVANVAMN